MKANELRIGNLVKYDDRVFTIHTIADEFPTLDTTEFGIGVVDWNNIKPIPLTEEWLLMFGFKKYDKETDYDSIYEYKNKRSIMPKSGYFEFAVGFIEGQINVFLYSGDCLKHIKYVHQLQNLYFALTNEELEIKEP